jgi:hypothetical protein
MQNFATRLKESTLSESYVLWRKINNNTDIDN